MNKPGLIILLGSWAAAGFLIALWLVGFLVGIGGGLIHLLLVLAIPVGAMGTIIGLVVLLAGKKTKET